jgi:putative sugar O-methyltransferase
VVAQIASDERSLATFRRNRHYRAVVESVTEPEGRIIFDSLKNADVVSLINRTQHADKIGNPRTYVFRNMELSPTTIRYAKIVEEISNLFDDFRGIKHICEIGVGYGGQARLICQYLQCRERDGEPLISYTLLDIENVLCLSRRYLENFSFSNSFIYKTKSELAARPEHPYDFFISNYAFAEFNKALQEEYLEKVILNSKQGYLLMNNGITIDGKRVLSKFGNNESYLDVELLEKIPRSKIIKDSVLTPKGIYLIVFGS